LNHENHPLPRSRPEIEFGFLKDDEGVGMARKPPLYLEPGDTVPSKLKRSAR
jgi:hypothetical protein